MKTKIKLLIVLLTISTFLGCNSENTSNSTEPSIYGHWVLQSKKQNGIDVPLTICEHENSISFNPDETYVRLKYTNVNETCTPDVMSDTNRIFTFDGTNLIMTYDDVAFGHKEDDAIVTNLDSDSMDLSVEFDDDDNGYYTFHFIKQP